MDCPAPVEMIEGTGRTSIFLPRTSPDPIKQNDPADLDTPIPCRYRRDAACGDCVPTRHGGRMALDISKPIDADDPDAKRLLAGLQGNILKSHGRDHSVLVFFQFSDRKLAARWIREVAQTVTTALRHVEEARRFSSFRIPGSLFVNVFLSATGMKHLGLKTPRSEAFTAGAADAGKRLADPPSETWEAPYRNPIDGMILLADDDLHYLSREAAGIFESVGDAARIVAVERGTVLRNSAGDPIEHFGYADGLSQPVFLKSDLRRNRRRQWDTAAGPSLVLVNDPNSDGYGSYLVYRKLEQDVPAFKAKEEELSAALGLGEDSELGGALVVGRFEDGTPVIHQPYGGLSPAPNDFNYARDPLGSRCPMHAHIRLVNPRTHESTEHRIARRGIPYGAPGDDQVGLLFLCFQANIEAQFERLQINQHNRDGLTGIDCAPQAWPSRWDGSGRTTFAFGGFVRLQGAAYLFAPSTRTLNELNG